MKLFLKKSLGDGIGIVADTYNSSTEETEMGNCCVFKASLGYVVIFRPAQAIEWSLFQSNNNNKINK